MKDKGIEDIDFIPLYVHICDTLGIDYKIKGEYVHSVNPILEDNHYSFQCYKNGFACSLNGDIDGKSRIFIRRLCLLLDKLELYIEYVMKELSIPSYELNKYRELLMSEKIPAKEVKNFQRLKYMFSKLFITQKDVMGIKYMKPIDSKKFISKNKNSKTTISEREPNNAENNIISNYMKDRSLNIINGVLEPTITIMNIGNKSFENKSIAIRYQNGYVKYRLLEGSLRYLTNTNKSPYNEFFEIYNTGNDTCILQEGELNIISILQSGVTDYDLYAMNNLNSLPKGSKQIIDYKNIIVVIDYDKYENVKDSLYKNLKEYTNGNIYIVYTNEENIDWNDMLQKNGKDFLKKYFINKIEKILKREW